MCVRGGNLEFCILKLVGHFVGLVGFALCLPLHIEIKSVFIVKEEEEGKVEIRKGSEGSLPVH